MTATFAVTALLLAGGKSRRMGKNKALLLFQGKTLISHLADSLQQSCQEVLISVADPKEYSFLQYPLVQDRHNDIGPLAGLHAGLKAAKYDWVFILGCDMPFWSPTLLKKQIEYAESGNFDLVCPESENGIEPLHMLVHKRALPAIEDSIARNDYKLSSFFSRIRVKILPWNEVKLSDSSGQCFQNWNRPEDVKS